MISEEEFISLYVQHETDLRSFARSLSPDQSDASDILQEACLAMWRKFDTLKSSKAFRRWAYSYVRLTAMNHLRKKQASPLRFSAEMIDILTEEWEGDEDLIADERQALTDCLGELTETQRKLLAHYYASAKTTAVELSERLQRPLAGIYKSLERARASLRTCIDHKLQTNRLP